MESVIEKLVFEVEDMIKSDYEWLSGCSWSGITKDAKVPDRYSDAFTDMAMTRLVLKLGFAEGSRLAFEINNHLENCCNSIPKRV